MWFWIGGAMGIVLGYILEKWLLDGHIEELERKKASAEQQLQDAETWIKFKAMKDGDGEGEDSGAKS